MAALENDDIQRFQMAGQDIPWLLEQWSRSQPDHPLLIWEPRSGAAETWSYLEFRDEVARIAAGLHARGVTRGDKVLIHADNCPEMIFAWYACARIGAFLRVFWAWRKREVVIRTTPFNFRWLECANWLLMRSATGLASRIIWRRAAMGDVLRLWITLRH